MTAVSPTPRELVVEAFSLFGGDDTAHLHFEDDGNLFVDYRPSGHGHQAGLVVVELGLDGYRTHRVRTEVRRFRQCPTDSEEYTYGGDRAAALDDAIDALTAVRDQLTAMRSPEAASETGRDGERRCRCGLPADALVHRAERNGHSFTA